VPGDAGRESEEKTLYWYTRLGTITLVETIFTRGRGGPELRRFATAAEVACRGYSLGLQRALTDFGADEPFATAAAKVREHYGITVPVSAVRTVTEAHGTAMRAAQPQGSPWPTTPGVPCLIVEMDGSMVPRVDTASPGPGVDRRKTRRLSWTEARLCLVRAPGSVTPRVGGTMGSATAAGDQLWECAVAAGVGLQTRLHAVGDGAPWIADHVERRFGAQATYLVDFYHVCDYLAAAAAVVAAPDPAAWLARQKAALKQNDWAAVLDTLRPAVEPDAVPDEAAPVRACVRYLSSRADALDFQGALAAQLPIGSGEVESDHRYLMQSRLKRAGTWWAASSLNAMMALRLRRANGEWDRDWRGVTPQAA
jgi:Uncharacterised protein family (UPF0236)